jgi:hypothetical protein
LTGFYYGSSPLYQFYPGFRVILYHFETRSYKRHLHRVLSAYVGFYNHRRPHQGLGQRCPVPLVAGSSGGAIWRRDILGGIIHDYERHAA